MVALITTALALIATILNLAVKAKTARETKTYATDIPKFEQALAARDTDLLSSQFDELRIKGDCDPGRPDDQEPAQRQL